MGYFSNPVINSLNTPSWTQDLIANIPPPGVYGRLFHGTDDNVIYWDNGIAWVPIFGGGTGNVTTLGGTAPRLPVWTGPTSLGDSQLIQVAAAGPSPAHVQSDQGMWLKDGTNNWFVKLLGAHASDTMQLAANPATPLTAYLQQYLANGTSYDIQHIYTANIANPAIVVLFRVDGAGSRLTLVSNTGPGSGIDLQGEDITIQGDVITDQDLSVGNQIVGGADVSAFTDVLAGQDVSAVRDVLAGQDLSAIRDMLCGRNISTGDPGGGAGVWKLGKVTAGVPVPTQTAIIEIDGISYSIGVH